MSIRLISWLNRFSRILESVDSKNAMGARNIDVTRMLCSLIPEVGPITIKNRLFSTVISNG
jgi:hypothetical protein